MSLFFVFPGPTEGDGGKLTKARGNYSTSTTKVKSENDVKKSLANSMYEGAFIYSTDMSTLDLSR